MAGRALREPSVAQELVLLPAGIFGAANCLCYAAYATGELGLQRLAGVTDVPNVASDRMLRSAGFSVLSECAGRWLRTYLYEVETSHQDEAP